MFKINDLIQHNPEYLENLEQRLKDHHVEKDPNCYLDKDCIYEINWIGNNTYYTELCIIATNSLSTAFYSAVRLHNFNSSAWWEPDGPPMFIKIHKTI